MGRSEYSRITSYNVCYTKLLRLYDFDKHVTHILTRHEQGAIHAAEGYAKVTGKAGVCFATSGPGATNLITGIADAQIDSIPLVCISYNFV